MNIVCAPRGGGKSTMIIDAMARDDDSVCLVATQQMVKLMAGMLWRKLCDDTTAKGRSMSMAQLESRFVTVDDLRAGRVRDRKVSRMHIDDLDTVLLALTYENLGIVTMTINQPPASRSRS